MEEICMSGSMSGERKRSVAAWPKQPRLSSTLPCVTSAVGTTVRNCTGDEGRPFEVGNQVLVSSHRKPLSSKAMVVLCQEGAKAPCCTRDEGGPFGAAL